MLVARSHSTSSVRTRQVGAADRDWIEASFRSLVRRYGLREAERLERALLASETAVGRWNEVAVTSPISGETYLTVTGAMGPDWIEIGCSCPGWTYRCRCWHVAAIVRRYFAWVIKDGKDA